MSMRRLPDIPRIAADFSLKLSRTGVPCKRESPPRDLGQFALQLLREGERAGQIKAALGAGEVCTPSYIMTYRFVRHLERLADAIAPPVRTKAGPLASFFSFFFWRLLCLRQSTRLRAVCGFETIFDQDQFCHLLCLFLGRRGKFVDRISNLLVGRQFRDSAPKVSQMDPPNLAQADDIGIELVDREVSLVVHLTEASYRFVALLQRQDLRILDLLCLFFRRQPRRLARFRGFDLLYQPVSLGEVAPDGIRVVPLALILLRQLSVPRENFLAVVHDAHELAARVLVRAAVFFVKRCKPLNSGLTLHFAGYFHY
jgi:hypothetical protein